MVGEPGLDAFFLPSGGEPYSRRFCIHHRAVVPTGVASHGVIGVPPFAEELNKVRRMIALQAHQLAGLGYEVLRPDLLGCGDSDGEWSAATWDRWIDDVWLAARWLIERGVERLWLWGTRAGALLAADAARRWPFARPPGMLFWHPQLEGKSALRQFLRLATVRASLAGEKLGVEAIQRALEEHGRIDVAGYELTSVLASGLAASRLDPPSHLSTGYWFEIGSTGEPVGGMLESRAEAWRAAGWQVSTQRVQGPAFWQSTEIEAAPALLLATTSVMKAAMAPAGAA